MYPMMLALLAGPMSSSEPTTTEDHLGASMMLDLRPPLPKYRPDLSLNMNREARRRTRHRQRGIGITRSKRNPRR